MPTYQYRCADCDHRFEAVQKFTDDALTQCPECGGSLRKVYGSIGVVFKGDGFYRTDSRSGAKTASSSKASTESAGGSKTDSSSSTTAPAGDKGSGSTSTSDSGAGSSKKSEATSTSSTTGGSSSSSKKAAS